MVKDGVAVQAQRAGLVARVAEGQRVNVTAECAALGVSRETFYKYLRRCRAEGVTGLFVRSRRPIRTRPMVAASVEDAIALARKRLDEAGLDIGATSVRWAVVIEVIDDHSRLNLACLAATSENGGDTWAAFTAAASRYGLPAQLLPDNGTAFSGRRRGWTSALEAAATQLGVATLTCTVRHPQTCGKVERSHGTARRWLARQPIPDSIEDLQALLETYRQVYINRRHQALDGLTPLQAWTLAPRSGPAGEPLPAPLDVTFHTVSTSGCIGVDGTEIGLGRRHAPGHAVAFRTGDDVTIFINGQYSRALTIDRTRRYQTRGE